MKKRIVFGVSLLVASAAGAENLQGVDKMICSTGGQVQICLEDGDCYSTVPWELAIPEFVVIDTKKNTISTTKASGENRSTEFGRVERTAGLIYLQGIDRGRAFSFVIHEQTGRMTVAVSRDGISVTVFGACTDTDI